MIEQQINLKGNAILRIGRTELDVPHLDKILTFLFPIIGPNGYKQVMNEIDSQNSKRPTTAQNLSLIDVVLKNQDNESCKDNIGLLAERFRKQYLWGCTENLAFPDGVFVYDNIDGKMPKTSQGLIELLNKNDEKVRLVKPGFKTGGMPILDFLKHPYTRAQIGENMIITAERVAKLLHKDEVYLFALDRADSDTITYTALDSGWYGDWLDLSGDFRGDGRGSALGYVDKKATQKNL